MDDNAIQKFRC